MGYFLYDHDFHEKNFIKIQLIRKYKVAQGYVAKDKVLSFKKTRLHTNYNHILIILEDETKLNP